MATNLTGTWDCDDGGTYLIRESDGELWWAGFSDEQGLHDGLTFTSVVHAKLRAPAGATSPTFEGVWAGVPRGKAMSSGTIVLDVVGPDRIILHSHAGGNFAARSWSRRTDVPAEQPTLRDLFNRARKNGTDTLLDNLKPLHDAAVVWGTLLPHTDPSGGDILAVHVPPRFGSAASIREYGNFLSDAGTDDDVTMQVGIEMDRLGPSDFWQSANWESGANIDGARAKLEDTNPPELHAEIVMFSRDQTAADRPAPALFPGWGEAGGNAVLVNGEPLQIDLNSGPLNVGASLFTSNLQGIPLGVGTRVRVTGPLVLDCGHFATKAEVARDVGTLFADFFVPFVFGGDIAQKEHDCRDDDKKKHNVEVHPVDTIDIINATASEDPTGVWGDERGMTYYVHQTGDTVFMLARGPRRGHQPTSVFVGSRQGSAIIGTFADVAGIRSAKGSLRCDLATTNVEITTDGGWFGSAWRKLYDAKDETPRLVVRPLGLITSGAKAAFGIDAKTAPGSIQEIQWSASDGQSSREAIFHLESVTSEEFTVEVQIRDALGRVESARLVVQPLVESLRLELQDWLERTERIAVGFSRGKGARTDLVRRMIHDTLKTATATIEKALAARAVRPRSAE